MLKSSLFQIWKQKKIVFKWTKSHPRRWGTIFGMSVSLFLWCLWFGHLVHQKFLSSEIQYQESDLQAGQIRLLPWRRGELRAWHLWSYSRGTCQTRPILGWLVGWNELLRKELQGSHSHPRARSWRSRQTGWNQCMVGEVDNSAPPWMKQRYSSYRVFSKL